jgi:hypothetical protein
LGIKRKDEEESGTPHEMSEEKDRSVGTTLASSALLAFSNLAPKRADRTIDREFPEKARPAPTTAARLGLALPEED